MARRLAATLSKERLVSTFSVVVELEPKTLDFSSVGVLRAIVILRKKGKGKGKMDLEGAFERGLVKDFLISGLGNSSASGGM